MGGGRSMMTTASTYVGRLWSRRERETCHGPTALFDLVDLEFGCGRSVVKKVRAKIRPEMEKNR
jgi:hypothetical protein